MHRGHDHEHHHHGNGAGAGHNHAPPRSSAAQWQTPHEPHNHHDPDDSVKPDLDLVETAFVESFTTASDPTSFLRLAHIPFEAKDAAGGRLVLLRVETEATTDVGAVMPHLGGETFRYDPLPAGLTSRRRYLRFVYFDGAKLRLLNLAEAAALGEL